MKMFTTSTRIARDKEVLTRPKTESAMSNLWIVVVLIVNRCMYSDENTSTRSRNGMRISLFHTARQEARSTSDNCLAGMTADFPRLICCPDACSQLSIRLETAEIAGMPWQPMDQSLTKPETPETRGVWCREDSKGSTPNYVKHAGCWATLCQTRSQMERRKFDTVQNEHWRFDQKAFNKGKDFRRC